MIAATTTPDVYANTETVEDHHEHVQAALRRAHAQPEPGPDDKDLGTGNAALDALLDASLQQTKATVLTCMRLGLVHNSLWDRIVQRLEVETEPLRSQIGRPTGDADSDVACNWLAWKPASKKAITKCCSRK